MKRREEIVNNIKDIGQSLIDDAEKIVSNFDYVTDLRITCYPMEATQAPYYSIEIDVIPENFINRRIR